MLIGDVTELISFTDVAEKVIFLFFPWEEGDHVS